MRKAFNMEGMAIRINVKSTAKANPFAHLRQKAGKDRKQVTEKSKKSERNAFRRRQFGQGSIQRSIYKVRRAAKKGGKREEEEVSSQS